MNGLVRDKKYPIDLILNQWARSKLGGKRIRRSNKRLKIFRKYGTDCVYCGLKGSFFAVERHQKGHRNNEWHINLYAIMPTGGIRMMTMDHVKAKSRGGSNSIDNLRPACSRCNSKKGNMRLSKWLGQTHENRIRVRYPIKVIDWRKLLDLYGWWRRIKWTLYNRKIPGLPRKRKWIKA